MVMTCWPVRSTSAMDCGSDSPLARIIHVHPINIPISIGPPDIVECQGSFYFLRQFKDQENKEFEWNVNPEKEHLQLAGPNPFQAGMEQVKPNWLNYN